MMGGTDSTRRFSDRVADYARWRPRYPVGAVDVLRGECALREGSTAEATTLPGTSVDLVVAAQAFHWFERAACRREFSRILRPDRHVALVWNERLLDATPFMRDYQALVRKHAPDYEDLVHTRLRHDDMDAFFGKGAWRRIELPNEQRLDRAGLGGRLRSSSYVPNEGQPGYEAMIADVDRLFEEHQAAGVVIFPYVTRLYVGRLDKFMI